MKRCIAAVLLVLSLEAIAAGRLSALAPGAEVPTRETHPPKVGHQEMAAPEMGVREETSVAGKEKRRPWKCCDMARCTRSSPPICTCQDKVKRCAKTCEDCHKDELDTSLYVCGDQNFGWPGPQCTKV